MNDCINDFFSKYKYLILLTLLIFGCVLCFSPVYKMEIISGLFLYITAIATALFAIDKYQSEQRITRLQKLYFEDTLYGQAKVLEAMMSQANNNMMIVENLFLVIVNLLERDMLELQALQDDLISVYDSTANKIIVGLDTMDFKRETLSKLLYESHEKSSCLPNWIKDFSVDIYRFNYRIKKISKIINEEFKNLILDFKDVNIGSISPERALILKEKIKCAREKMKIKLYPEE
jgi:hypothetical protein